MGLWNALGRAVSAAKDVAMTPVDLAADIITGGGDGYETRTERRVRNIVEKVEDAYEETFDD